MRRRLALSSSGGVISKSRHRNLVRIRWQLGHREGLRSSLQGELVVSQLNDPKVAFAGARYQRSREGVIPQRNPLPKLRTSRTRSDEAKLRLLRSKKAKLYGNQLEIGSKTVARLRRT